MTAPRMTVAPALMALVVWATGDKATHAVRSAWGAGGDVPHRLELISPALVEEFSGHFFTLSFELVDVLGGVGLLMVVLMMIAYQRAGRQTERIGEEHGSAAWGTRRDITPFAPRRGEPAIVFTRTEALACDSRRTHRNLNVLVLGSAGSQKTRSFVMPNVLSGAGVSLAITDPKGENMRELGEQLKTQGYDVRALNLVDLAASDGFNPLVYVNPDQPEVDIAALAETIVTNTESGHGRPGADAFWERAERALLTALIAYTYFTDALDRDGAEGPDAAPASLVDVVDLSKQLQASEEDEGYRSGVDEKMTLVRLALASWEDLPDMSKAESDRVRDGLAFAVAQYRIFEQGAGETKKGVIISVGVRLAILDVPDVRRLMSVDTLELGELGSELGAVFCILPDTHTTFKFVSALFWRCLFTTNVYVADHSATGRLERDLQCYLDEFANIGTIPGFEQLIATVRSRGIGIAIILQALAQLKAMYRDGWETITGNCDSTLFLGGTEVSTLEWLSKRLGSETIKAEETSQNFGANGSWSRSMRNVKRELMTPDELAQLSDDECIYLLRGVRPFRSRKAAMHVPAAHKASRS